MRLDSTELDMLRRFARLPEGERWVAILKRNLAETDVRLRTAIGDDLLRTQGKAQLLAELISQVVEAEEKLEKPATTRRPVVRSTEWTG